MGLLDDAIREHLELKRSRGADVQEITRQEREAFGSARGAEPQAPAPPETEPGEHAGAVPMSAPAHEPPEPDPIPEPPVVEAELPDPPAPEAPDPEPVREPSVIEDEIDWSEPEPRAPAGEPAAEAPAEDEDVLEETPEFLQETPEHDRLWFEQRPPKDFDF